MIKNKFIISGILGLTIGLGTVTTTATVVKAANKEELQTQKDNGYINPVEAVNDLRVPLVNARDSNNIEEFRRLVKKMHEAVDYAEKARVGVLTLEALREREQHWQEYLDKKEAELANVKKKSTPKEEVAKPKAPSAEKKESKPKNKKTNKPTSAKAAEQIIETKPKTKVEQPKEAVVKEESATKSNEVALVVDKVSNEEPTPTEEIKETVKEEEVTPIANPVKEEVTPKDITVNKIELETDKIESTLLAKVMVIVGAVLVIVGAVAAIKIRKKN